jgi:hypothetical protein
MDDAAHVAAGYREFAARGVLGLEGDGPALVSGPSSEPPYDMGLARDRLDRRSRRGGAMAVTAVAARQPAAAARRRRRRP